MITESDIRRAMTYAGSIMAETITVAGYTIEIEQDSCCASPYDGDCNSPAIWLSGDRHGGFTEYGGASLESFFDGVKDSWVSRHWRAICGILELDQASHDMEAREHAADTADSLSGARSSLFIDRLHELRSESWGHGIDYLETLCALYRLAGIPAETFQRNGYCQGDSVYGLIVMTPEWAETVGAQHALGKPDMTRCDADMKAQADTYGAWAFGDCYGYSITDAQGDDVDSCWGFIGTDAKLSGILEEIVSAINHDIAERHKARVAQVKTWIRNRVPLAVRASATAC